MHLIVRDATTFMAACVCVPMGLDRIAAVWNSDPPSACCVTYFDCINVTGASDLRNDASWNAPHRIQIFSSTRQFLQTLFMMEVTPRCCQSFSQSTLGEMSPGRRRWVMYLEMGISSDCISSLVPQTEINVVGFSHLFVFVVSVYCVVVA